MSELEGFDIRRAGGVVTVKWKGLPSFTIGVWAMASDAEAFELAACALARGERQGFDPEEVMSCVRELRRRAGIESSE